jgi:oxaloacetate decarboxylase alpha subunit
MFSNLISQLKEQNALHRLKEVLEEVPRVRKELGYPPLVTPTSQLVGSQAVFNVLSGKRYSIVPKEVKDYVKGFYGRPPAPIDEKVKKLIIGDEKAITCRPADLLEPFLDRSPEEVKQYFQQEEDALTYALFPTAALEFFKKRAKKVKERELELKREELAEIAAISAAITLHLASEREVRAIIPTRRFMGVSPWVLVERQKLTQRGGYIASL